MKGHKLTGEVRFIGSEVGQEVCLEGREALRSLCARAAQSSDEEIQKQDILHRPDGGLAWRQEMSGHRPLRWGSGKGSRRRRSLIRAVQVTYPQGLGETKQMTREELDVGI